MEGFTLVDGIVAVIIVLSAVLAWSRGFVREALAIAGWVGAAVAAFFFAPVVEPLMLEVPYVSDFLGGSCELSMIAAFFVVFAVALIILSIFVPLFSGAVQNSAVGGVDRGLGFLFGIVRGALLVVIALLVYDRMIVGDPIEIVDNSRTAQIFSETGAGLENAIPENLPQWFVARYEELIGACAETESGVETDSLPATSSN